MLFSTKNIYFDMVKSDAELQQILTLQTANLKYQLSETTQQSQGFLTVQHTLAQLLALNQDLPQIIAKADQQLIGYALAMSADSKGRVPELQSMFDVFDALQYQGKPLSAYGYYVMGQICVHADYRGKGIFRGLYETHKTLFSHNFELCITEISSSNERSIRAHAQLGFETIHTYNDELDEWHIAIWDFAKQPKNEWL